MPRIGKSIETKSRLELTRWGREGVKEWLFEGYSAKERFLNPKELAFTPQCKNNQYHWIVHFIIVNCMLCEFHLNNTEREQKEINLEQV